MSKSYKNNMKANDNITLEFKSGEITALIGHNGAGKTTLLNQMIGLIKPTSGSIFVNQMEVTNKPAIARKLVSSMPQFQLPLKGVSVIQSIESVLRVKGYSRENSKRKAEDIIDFLQINKWKNVSGEKLSGGLQRLTSFAISVTDDSPIIVLDEPTNDVDPIRRVLMWKYLRKLADNGKIIIIVTHNLLEVERYANRYILLDKGSVQVDMKIDQKLLNSRHLLSIWMKIGSLYDSYEEIVGRNDKKYI
ncbi:ABC transporter ATP-binding protein [Atopobacter sp. AH10]|nr:ABC transporter ATP-binding protein [Atopobacter sp. AH10]